MPATEVHIPAGEIRLSGTLRMSDGASAGVAALLLSGSGPIDRNSDAKRLRLGVAGRLAERLSAAGITTLRYDKRGVGKSGGDYRSAGLNDNIADARAALAHLREVAPDDRVVVVGHSEGALIALDLAASTDPPDAAVLLAGSARTGEEVLRWQAHMLQGDLPAPVRGMLRLLRTDIVATQATRLERIRNSSSDVIRIQGLRINARWFREFLAFDPAARFASVSIPVLAITGSADRQVNPDDVATMAAAIPGHVDGHVIDGVNHILRAGDGSPRRYKAQVGQPLDDRVVSLLTSWLLRLATATADTTG